MQTITFEGCDHIVMSPEDFEALKKDAARYRWLRDADQLATKCVYLTYSREGLDNAIDTAMSKD